jgi:hypothetical protein
VPIVGFRGEVRKDRVATWPRMVNRPAGSKPRQRICRRILAILGHPGIPTVRQTLRQNAMGVVLDVSSNRTRNRIADGRVADVVTDALEAERLRRMGHWVASFVKK